MNSSEMVRKFEQAGLVLKLAKSSLGGPRSDPGVFGLDIARKLKGSSRNEFFRMWPGDESNLVQVMDVDRKLGQLVLAVKEKKRTFSAPVLGWEADKITRKGIKAYLASRPNLKGRIFSENGVWYQKEETPESRRCMLLGFDERQLFMATLPRSVTTVKQAHASLRSTTLTLAEGRQRGRTIRQGEWFFVNATKEEAQRISEGLRKNKLFILKKRGVFEAGARSGGKPHVADELVEVPPSHLDHGFSVRRRADVFVRGGIRHPDHKTVKFSSWRKVIRNNEGGAGAVGGGTWID